MNPYAFGVLAAGVTAGVCLIISGLRNTSQSRPRFHRDHLLRLVAALAAAAVVFVATSWIVAGVVAASAVVFVPRLVRGGAERRRRLERIEAIATWTEAVRDVIAGSAGLEQAILATAETAPDAIRSEVTDLARRLREGNRLATALRCLGDDLHDPTADLVIAALVMAADHPARRLAELLGELAAEAREQVSMRLRVETARRQLRTSVRVVVITTVVFAGGLIAANRSYLEPYSSITGQVVLSLIAMVFAAALTWLARIARDREPERFLAENRVAP